MPLDFFKNTFAGNPLDRASERRGDEAWIAEKLASSDSLAIALWNGKPLVENAASGGAQIAYLPANMAGEMSGGAERLLFMGLWKETAVFALDIEGGTDPADGPLQGLGRFEELRGLAPRMPETDAAIVAASRDRCRPWSPASAEDPATWRSPQVGERLLPHTPKQTRVLLGPATPPAEASSRQDYGCLYY